MVRYGEERATCPLIRWRLMGGKLMLRVERATCPLIRRRLMGWKPMLRVERASCPLQSAGGEAYATSGPVFLFLVTVSS